MYTLIKDAGGRVLLRTHVAPADLSSEDARRLLRSLRPLLSTLRSAALSNARFEAEASPGAKPEPDPAKTERPERTTTTVPAATAA